MKKQQLSEISAWFNGFVAAFRATSPADQRNYDLKVEHTVRVREVMERLTASLDLPREDRTLATAIAICHDIGRFPQYRDFGTFNDAVSTNHAALSVQTLKSEGVLDALADDRRSLLLQAVSLHNAFILPEDLQPVVRRFALLIRDADKLDIWRVMIEYCSAPPEERASAVIWELPETGACSKRALEEVAAGRMLNRSLLVTADDFKLLQLSWVFDLNFPESFSLVIERGYLETLAGLLPCQPGCQEAVDAVRDHVRGRSEKNMI
ncbi:MAG TPA: HD domain-containing protein [Geobacteraceae bacterium]|nr:HD domain-containing protein [Geobacteraceae bacterium]